MSQEFESDFEIVQEATEGEASQVSEETEGEAPGLAEETDMVEAPVDAEVEVKEDAEVDIDAEAETEAAPTAIPTSFGTVTDRLSEIAEIMEDETMPLDDALDLLEEAVALGMQASSLLESDMNERDAEEAEEADEEDTEGAIAETEARTADGTAEVANNVETTSMPAEDNQVGEAEIL